MRVVNYRTCGSSSVGRASASQAEGRRFEPGLPLWGKRMLGNDLGCCRASLFSWTGNGSGNNKAARPGLRSARSCSSLERLETFT